MFAPFAFFIEESYTVDNDFVNMLRSLSHSEKTWEDLEDLKLPVQETVHCHWMQKQSHCILTVGNCVIIYDIKELLTFIAYLLTFIA